MPTLRNQSYQCQYSLPAHQAGADAELLAAAASSPGQGTYRAEVRFTNLQAVVII